MSNLKLEIQRLRVMGLSFSKIASKLECSKSTVCYHLSKEQREKNLVRGKRRREYTLTRHLDSFKRKRVAIGKRGADFRKASRKTRAENEFTNSQLIAKIEANPVCYLTGRVIDLNVSKSYELDHILPASRGGAAELNNVGLSCRAANRAKNNLTNEEFLQLCLEVVKHHGFVVLEG